jgi:hypothetical protein
LLAHARQRTILTAVLAALAVLARPEAALLIPLLVLAAPVSARRVVTFTVITIICVTPAVWFSMATVGTPIPATAAAKIEGGLIGWLAGVRESAMLTWLVRPWRFSVAWVRWLAATHWLLPLAIVPGIVVIARRRGRALAVPALALVAHPLAMALLAPYRDPSFQEGRYSAHLLPLAMLVLAAGLALVLAAAAPLLCTLVFGGEFADSVPQLRVLALSAFGITALELLGNALTAQRKPMLEAVATGVAFLTTLALDLVLIPRFGGIGAAIATSVAYSAGGVAIAAIFVRSLGARPADLRPRPSDLAWLAGKFRTRLAT